MHRSPFLNSTKIKESFLIIQTLEIVAAKQRSVSIFDHVRFTRPHTDASSNYVLTPTRYSCIENDSIQVARKIIESRTHCKTLNKNRPENVEVTNDWGNVREPVRARVVVRRWAVMRFESARGLFLTVTHVYYCFFAFEFYL